MKKNSELGSLVSRTCGAASCANSASATRSPCQLSDSANVRRNCTERRHRSGCTSFTYIDAEASCRMTMSALPRRTSVVSACGRASATITRLAATSAHSQKARSPNRLNRSRSGSTRPCRMRRTSRRRRTTRHAQTASSAALPASSQR